MNPLIPNPQTTPAQIPSAQTHSVLAPGVGLLLGPPQSHRMTRRNQVFNPVPRDTLFDFCTFITNAYTVLTSPNASACCAYTGLSGIYTMCCGTSCISGPIGALMLSTAVLAGTELSRGGGQDIKQIMEGLKGKAAAVGIALASGFQDLNEISTQLEKLKTSCTFLEETSSVCLAQVHGQNKALNEILQTLSKNYEVILEKRNSFNNFIEENLRKLDICNKKRRECLILMQGNLQTLQSCEDREQFIGILGLLNESVITLDKFCKEDNTNFKDLLLKVSEYHREISDQQDSINAYLLRGLSSFLEENNSLADSLQAMKMEVSLCRTATDQASKAAESLEMKLKIGIETLMSLINSMTEAQKTISRSYVKTESALAAVGAMAAGASGPTGLVVLGVTEKRKEVVSYMAQAIQWVRGVEEFPPEGIQELGSAITVNFRSTRGASCVQGLYSALPLSDCQGKITLRLETLELEKTLEFDLSHQTPISQIDLLAWMCEVMQRIKDLTDPRQKIMAIIDLCILWDELGGATITRARTKTTCTLLSEDFRKSVKIIDAMIEELCKSLNLNRDPSAWRRSQITFVCDETELRQLEDVPSPPPGTRREPPTLPQSIRDQLREESNEFEDAVSRPVFPQNSDVD